jgi:hypothetical protein
VTDYQGLTQARPPRRRNSLKMNELRLVKHKAKNAQSFFSPKNAKTIKNVLTLLRAVLFFPRRH